MEQAIPGDQGMTPGGAVKVCSLSPNPIAFDEQTVSSGQISARDGAQKRIWNTWGRARSSLAKARLSNLTA
jgi:hypothetical protein